MSRRIPRPSGVVFTFVVWVIGVHPVFTQDLASKIFAQKKIRNEGKSLISFLNELQEKTNINFAYQKKYLEGKYLKQYPSSTNLELNLQEILKSFHLSLKKIDDNPDVIIYVIYPDNSTEKNSEAGDEALKLKVSGKVTVSSDGTPIPGVSVILKDGDAGTITDEEGKYFVEVSHKDLSTLIFSSIGFTSAEIPVNGRNNIDVLLSETSNHLSEVVVTALGINRDQKALGYSITTFNADQLNSSGNTNFASAMYGKAAGVRIRTAPGGATSAVTMQIRGLNSLNYNTQPLYIIDGVIMRDGNEKGSAGINNADYFTDQRIRGNGILDINPSDIETLTVLKGASATALYGSDASSGAVVITTKKGLKKPGLGVEINYTYNIEQVAFIPHYQNSYGPGFNRERNMASGATAEGWVPIDADGDGVTETRRPLFEAYSQFGPRMEGQKVMWWDGKIRTYSPRPNNYKDFYRPGQHSIFNTAISNQTGIASYRISFSQQDYQDIQVGGNFKRNTVNLNSTLKINEKVSTDVTLNFIASNIHNRPVKINRLMSSWTGFFSRAEDMSVFRDKYKTSQSYKWVPYDQAQLNPEEALQYATPRGYEVMNFFWKQLRNSEDELQDRLISSVNINYEILKNLQLRGRFGSDFTSLTNKRKEYNEYPVSFNGNNSTGSYSTADGRYSNIYTDAFLTYFNEVSRNLTYTVNTGFQARNEKYHDQSITTNGGLALENWFNLNNSYNPAKLISDSHIEILKYAFLGLLNVNFKDYLFVEATARQEYSSTLPPKNNSYFYPSVNSSFILSQAFHLPSAFQYSRLRASYGVVGNAPPAYESNVLYDFATLQTQRGSVVASSAQGSLYGNNKIKSENKYEMEFGLETQLLQGRLGFDLAYYSNKIKNQILKLDLPTTTGASRILSNLGELRSKGLELTISATPIAGKLTWETIANMAVNTTKVHDLIPGVDWLVFKDLEGGAIKVVAEKGKPVGNIYVYPRKTDASGNFVISNEGLYVIDKTRYVKAGNILPKFVGGFTNSISIRRFKFNFTMDYSLGGKIISPSLKYGMGSGMYESTLKYRDANHGGLPYYINNEGNKILLSNDETSAPDGSMMYHDGVLLKGVTEEGLANSKVIDAATYYLNTFDWGNNAWNEEGAIYNNSYVKMREAVLSYNLPKSIATKLHVQYIRFSLVGRNIFYVWRTLKNLDPESTIGTSWMNQGLDEGSSAASRSYGASINMGF